MTNRFTRIFSKDKSKRKKIFLFLTITIIIVFLGLLVISSLNMKQNPLNYRTFASMEELSHIDSYAVKDLDCKSDGRLNGKKYEEKYTKQILYNGNTYDLYAYKFEDPLDAQRYCFDSNNISDLDKAFRFSYNETCLWAFYKEYAYCVRGDNYNSFAEFYNFLVKDFTIEF